MKRNTSTPAAQQHLTVWIRPPTKRGGRICGLSRSMLYSLAADGKIKTACVRQPGKARGIRLFHLPSIVALIETHTDGVKSGTTQ